MTQLDSWESAFQLDVSDNLYVITACIDFKLVLNFFSCYSDIEDDVQSLQHFSTDLIVEGTSRFIKVIRHDVDLPHRLPPGMSARFRIGTSLAEAVKVRRFFMGVNLRSLILKTAYILLLYQIFTRHLVKRTNSFCSIGAWLQRWSWISDFSLFKRKRHTKSVYVPRGKITEGWSRDCGRNNGFVTFQFSFVARKRTQITLVEYIYQYICRGFRDVTTKYSPWNIKEAKVAVDTTILQKQRNCMERITSKMAERGTVQCPLVHNNLIQYQQVKILFNVYFQNFFNVGYQFCAHLSRWPSFGPRRFTWFK